MNDFKPLPPLPPHDRVFKKGKWQKSDVAPDRVSPSFSELSSIGLAVYDPMRSGIYYNDGEIEIYNYKYYKWKSIDLVPDQTDEELKELNEYMKNYE